MDAALPEPLRLGDHLALDFVNTRAMPNGVPTEWIGDGAALQSWLRKLEVVPASVLGERAIDDRVARKARALREWLRNGLTGKHAYLARTPFTADLGLLNDALSHANAFTAIERSGRALLRVKSERFGSAASVLVPLGEAIASLLVDENLEHVRRCEGEGCTIWFLDRTKSHRRRFCSPALCGNRAKVAAFRARQRTDRDAR